MIPGDAEEREFRAGDQRGSRQRGSPGSRQTEGQGWTIEQRSRRKSETSQQEGFLPP